MTACVEQGAGGFLALTTLAAVDTDTFRGPPAPGPAGQASRGLLGAQGLVAAGRTVDTDWRWVRSAHVTHLADGDSTRPVVHRVERLRDTEHLSTRLVRATQDDAVLATTTVSFHAPPSIHAVLSSPPLRGRGPTRQEAVPDEWPDPHTLPATGTGAAMDVRYVDCVPWTPAPVAANRMWLRFVEEIPDRILLHAAAIVHAADLLLVEPLVGPDHAAPGLRAETLGLAVHIHRGFRADDWMRHEHSSPVAADHRALTTGRFLSSMGRLVASVSQETAFLPVPDTGAGARTDTGPASGSRKE